MTASNSNDLTAAQAIKDGRTALGIEFGSTRIKAVLIDESAEVLATGGHGWENSLVDGLWSYSEDSVWEGLQAAFAELASNVAQKYGTDLQQVGSLGVSAMMHGYVALNSDGQLLTPFRTWRNTNTGPATEALSPALNFNMPHRWSSAHLFQAVLDEEEHLSELAEITTLAGLVHQRLSGEAVLGVGDASGMFPIDPHTKDYDTARLQIFDDLLKEKGMTFSLAELLPKVLVAGEEAGRLTEAGAALLDPTGNFKSGALMCPPEGDAGTGMVATNAVAPRTGNVSAGTSIFAMIVLEDDLERVHPELDLVCTPDGLPVAMVHSNNGTSEWDQWVKVFGELLAEAGLALPKSDVYDLAYAAAAKGDPDGGGLIAYNFLSGEPVVGLENGRPLFMRLPDSSITLPNFLRTQLMAIFGVLRLGMNILVEDEGVQVDRLFAHGGLFKTPVVAQRQMAAALETAVSVSETAGEGGPWGMALLALYANGNQKDESLPEFLDRQVFANLASVVEEPLPADVEGYKAFLNRYVKALPVEAAAAENS